MSLPIFVIMLNDSRTDTIMKQLLFLPPVMALLALLAVSCSPDSDYSGFSSGSWTSGSSGSGVSYEASLGELTSFDIEVDTTALSETETIPTDDEDYVENNSFTNVVSIVFNGSLATWSGSVDGVTVTVDGADVVVTSSASAVCLNVSGTTSDGFLKIYSDKKFELVLNGVSITNPDGAALNIQSKKRGYVVLADGTTSTLVDGIDYADETSDEDMKATLFSEGKLLFSGSGRLCVYANCKAGIRSDDYVLFRPGNNVYVKATSGNGIKGNDAIYIKGGVINVEASAAASKALSSDGLVQIDGGRTTAITTGTGEYDSSEGDVSGSAGVKADSVFVMNGGTLLCKSTGQGGKGISCDREIMVNGGTVMLITSGQKYSYGSYSTSPKGMKSDGAMYLNGGTIMVRATGGEGSEGIESKSTLNITGGVVESYCYDDAINSVSNMTVSGGSVFAYSTANDGIDSNASLYVTGGLVIACGTSQPEGGIDCDEGTFYLSGGTVIGLGGASSSPSASTASQPAIVVGGNQLAGDTYLTLGTSDGTNVFAFLVPRTYSSYVLFLTSPELSRGSSYTLASGATVSGGTEFMGYVEGADVSGGTTLFSLTLSSMVTTYNYTGTAGNTGGGGWRNW